MKMGIRGFVFALITVVFSAASVGAGIHKSSKTNKKQDKKAVVSAKKSNPKTASSPQPIPSASPEAKKTMELTPIKAAPAASPPASEQPPVTEGGPATTPDSVEPLD